MIIINADDFGLSKPINKAILACFDNNYISSTSMIVNIEEPFKDAVEIILNGLIPKNSVGIHLNLEEGKPITENIKNLDFVCNSAGEFYYNFRKKNRFYLDPIVLKFLKEELAEQILLFKKSTHLLPTHIDSHNHTHTEFAILKTVIDLSKDFGIKKVRLSRNLGHGIGPKHKLYKLIYNSILRLNLNCTNYFGDIVDYNEKLLNEKYNYEVMVHPRYNEKNKLIELDGEDFINKIEKLFKQNNSKIVSYHDL